jgi:hypothetical protein
MFGEQRIEVAGEMVRGTALQPLLEFMERDYLGSCVQKQSLAVTCFESGLIPSNNIAMCRNIKTLFNFDPPVTEEEVRAACLQFVRKISGFSKPSKANERLFQAAVDEIAGVSARLLHSLETNAPPKNREEEAARAKARAAERFGD